MLPLLLAILFLAAPVDAQTNQALPPDMSGAAGNLTPPQKHLSSLVQPEATIPKGRILYRWSLAAVLAGSAADAASSWRSEEANPALAGPEKRFGVESVAIKAGLVGASLLIQHVALRHRPEFYKRAAWINLITAGALGAVAGHNVSVR